MLFNTTHVAPSTRKAPVQRAGALFAVVSALLLAACGGGGGGGSTTSPADAVLGPPAAAATLGTTGGDATSAVQSVIATAQAVATQRGQVNAVSSLFGSPLAARNTLASQSLVRPQAVTTRPCSFFLDSAACSGSVVLDTNLPDDASRVNPGDYAAMNFSGLSGTVFGLTVVFNGELRIDFLSTIDLNSESNGNVDFVVTSKAFSGTIGGTPFGPVSEAARLQINAQGATVTAGGKQYSALGNVSYSGNGNYNVSGARVRTAHWSNPSGHVDLSLSDWRMAAGRPLLGSLASVGGGNASTISVQVTGTTATTVSYDVIISTPGASGRFTVTADYANSPTAPTYRADAQGAPAPQGTPG